MKTINNYLSLFLDNLFRHDDGLKIIIGNESIDKADLQQILNGYLDYLEKENVSAGQEVVVLGGRNLESITFFHALLINGSIPFLIDRSLPTNQIEQLSKGKKIFVSGVTVPDLKDHYKIPNVEELHSNKSYLNSYQNTLNSVSNNDDILFVTHTSGTTGLPKIVNYKNKNIFWAIKEYAALYNLSKNKNVLFALPFHYCFGFIACCLSPLANNGNVILLPEDEQNAENIAQLISKHKINILVINPLFYSQLCKLNLEKFNFSSLKISDSGGEILPIEIIKKFQEQTNVTITEGYGLTETSSLTHFLQPEENGLIQLGSVGKPCSQVQSLIVDENMNEVGVGSIGELLVKGPMVVDGYADTSKNAEAFWNDWFKTGDLFYKDEKDYYYLVGRKKDAISVSPELFKLTSDTLPSLIGLTGIKDFAYRFSDKDALQIYILPTDDSPMARISLEESITSQLPSQIKKIATIKFVAFVPRTASGKVKRNALE